MPLQGLPPQRVVGLVHDLSLVTTLNPFPQLPKHGLTDLQCVQETLRMKLKKRTIINS